MTMVTRDGESDEALIEVAKGMMTRRAGKSERVCYYRTPMKKVDGSPHLQAGWIGWDQTQEGIQLRKIMRGYIPLQKYGFIDAERDPDGVFDQYGEWGRLLSTADGMREIPASQIIAYFWYDEDQLRASLRGSIPPTLKVKDGMVLWPQLKGMNIKVYTCPECVNQRFNEPVLLARHLRNWHDYDRQDIVAFGNEQGVDFRTEVSRGGKIQRGYSFEDVTENEFIPETNDPDDAGFLLEIAKPHGKSKD